LAGFTMTKPQSLLLAVFLSITLFSFAASSQTAKGSIGNGTAKRGVATRGSVVLEIPQGLHVNSNRPNNEYLIPTVVHLSGTGVKVSKVSYPRGMNVKFKFSEKELNVYEGTIVFPFTVTAPKSFRGKNITVDATVDFQACTEELCYPQRSEKVSITAAVR